MPRIRERLEADMKAAMKGKEALRLSTIRLMRAEILKKDKERGEEATEEEILKLLQGMVKSREEAARQYEKGGRPELAAKERGEIEVVKEYLPAPLGAEEIRREAEAAIADLGATSMKDMGKVMGVLTKKLASQATGAEISQAVKELLSG